MTIATVKDRNKIEKECDGRSVECKRKKRVNYQKNRRKDEGIDRRSETTSVLLHTKG